MGEFRRILGFQLHFTTCPRWKHRLKGAFGSFNTLLTLVSRVTQDSGLFFSSCWWSCHLKWQGSRLLARYFSEASKYVLIFQHDHVLVFILKLQLEVCPVWSWKAEESKCLYLFSICLAIWRSFLTASKLSCQAAFWLWRYLRYPCPIHCIHPLSDTKKTKKHASLPAARWTESVSFSLWGWQWTAF